MSNTATFKKYFQENNFNLEDISDADGAIFRTRERLKSGGSVTIVYFFNKDETILDIKLFNIANISNPLKKENLYSLFNELNGKYRFISFYEFENELNGTYSFALPKNGFNPSTVVDLTLSMIDAADAEYPKFMKILWS